MGQGASHSEGPSASSQQSFPKLLQTIEDECKRWVEIVKNTKGQTWTVENKRGYIVSELTETENKVLNVLQVHENRENLRRNLADAMAVNVKYAQDKTKMETDIREAREVQEMLQNEMSQLNKNIDDAKARNEKLTNERTELLHRLSKLAGDKLTRDNPNIADLSDKNRPTKLGEYYSQLYDNEWTDAYESLNEAGYPDSEAIATLRMTLQNAFQFCKGKSDLLLQKTEEATNLLFEEYKQTFSDKDKKLCRHLTIRAQTGVRADQFMREMSSLEDIILPRKWKQKDGSTQSNVGTEVSVAVASETQCEKTMTQVDVEDKLKKMRKEVAEAMVPAVQKAYLKSSWDQECIPAMKPFIKQCLFIGWMMVVQSPPLCFQTVAQRGEEFNTDKYRHYVTGGKTVAYTVWPAMLLHKDGPVICKGVADAMKANADKGIEESPAKPHKTGRQN